MQSATNKPSASYIGKEPYVFVCYSHQDSDPVYEQISRFQQKGVNVWYDEGIEGGAEWSETIAQAISGCFNFIFFVTPNSVNSEHCRRELTYCNTQAIPVTAIYLSPTELSAGMKLSLGNRQSLLKYQLSPAKYEDKLTHVLRIGGIQEPPQPDYMALQTGIAIDERKGIVVLPFTNRSAGEENNYLGEGVADEITIALSTIDALRVISSVSARQIDVSNKDVGALGKELDVDYVLQGSIQTMGDRLQVTAQLPSTKSGEIIWGNKWKGSLEQIFEIQETIAQSVAEALEIHLGSKQKAQLVNPPVSDVRAYEYFLRARQSIHQFTAEALSSALQYLERGEEISGRNIHILAAKAYTHWQFHNAGIDLDPKHLVEAETCIEEIFKIDPSSPDAHRLKGLMQSKKENGLQISINHLKIALSANPNDTDTLFWLALYYSFAGRYSSAIVLAERLHAIDPLTTIHQMYPGWLTLMDGQIALACEQLVRGYENNPGNPIIIFVYGQALAMNGQTDAALEVLGSIGGYTPGSFFDELGKFFAYCIQGEKEQALSTVTEKLQNEARSDLQYSWTIAQCYSLIGEIDQALEWLENAIHYGMWNYPLVASNDPLLEPVREDARFENLASRLKKKWVYFED